MVHHTGSWIRIAVCAGAALLALAVRSPADSSSQAKSGTCFEADIKDKSLHEIPCNLGGVRLAASSGDVYAQNQLGLISALRVAPGGGIREARSWFEKAARRGYAPAEVNLAVTYLNGWGTAQNYGAALNWLNAAAKQGHPRAYANLGILYMNGWGVRRDYALAFQNLQLAADAGDAGAQANLGYLYDGGLGVVADHSAAADLYQRSAEQGNALGQNNLADLYLRGLGVRQSYSQAFFWFEKSAKQGYSAAQIKLGFLLMNGLGCAKDPAAAYSWVLSASRAGDHRGDDYLKALAAQLEQQQLAQAEEGRYRKAPAPAAANRPEGAAKSFVP